MRGSRLGMCLLAAGLALAGTAAVAEDATAPVATETYAKQKVVYHNSGANPDDPSYFKRMLGNVQNHIVAVGEDNVEIAVVSHGPGVDMLLRANTDPELAKRIDTLRSEGVRFLVCANSMHAHDLSVADLYGATEDDVVPSGVAEIAHLEQQGYVYLHP